MSLRSSSQQPPDIYVTCDRLQPQIESVTKDLSPARGTARPGRFLRLSCFIMTSNNWLRCRKPVFFIFSELA